jgi:8-oxo-dGTP pyrophosphatase MutT (NUDIX family)
MRVVYAVDEAPDAWPYAIFLAGPTPRDPETPSWRPEALQILEELGYDGVVFIPESADGKWKQSYTDQVEWELDGLEKSDRIVFWVPRDLRVMPAMTTNVEFGNYVKSGKVVLGFPEGAPKMRYLEHLAGNHKATVTHTLRETLEEAITACKPALRKAGERNVPLDIWNTPMFQAWYDQLQKVGNRLDDAKVLWTFRAIGRVFSYVLKVKIWIASESRWKENEWIFARTDVACSVLYRRLPVSHGALELSNTEIVLVKEFRSPSRTPDGFIHELPGGTVDLSDNNKAEAAGREAYEETGIAIATERFRHVGSRQALGILSTHQIHCYAAELSEHEMAQAKKLAEDGTTFGEEKDTELTYVKVTTYGELLAEPDVDWTTLGLVTQALLNR